MVANKTECALAIFQTKEKVVFPGTRMASHCKVISLVVACQCRFWKNNLFLRSEQ